MKKLILLIAFICGAYIAEAQKVSAMPAITPITGSELIMVVQGGINKKMTATEMKTYSQTGLNKVNWDSAYAKSVRLETEMGSLETGMTPEQVVQLDTAYNKSTRLEILINDTVSIETIVPMLADSGSTYVTPYQVSSLSNILIDNQTNRAYYISNGYRYNLAITDSIDVLSNYGPEILADPGFTSSATWYEFGNSLVDLGVLTITNADVNTYIVNSNGSSTEGGKTYKVQYTINSISGGGINVSVAGGVGTNRTTPGTYTEELTATGADYLYINPGLGTTCVIDNISLKEKL